MPIPIVHTGIKNENQMWFINYRKELQGLVMTVREIESHYYDIHTVLLNTFLNYSYAFIVLEGYMITLIKQTDFFYLFDSHAKDSSGMHDPNGTVVRSLSGKNWQDLYKADKVSISFPATPKSN